MAWKKAEARTVAKELAEAMAKAFNVPVPKVEPSPLHGGHDWEWRFESGTIWTDAGPAEMSVDISATFAHFYFRFREVERAKAAGYVDGGRLNTASGKWNNWEAAPTPLEVFARACVADFERVADPSPDPEMVAAWEAHEAARLALWKAEMEKVFVA